MSHPAQDHDAICMYMANRAAHAGAGNTDALLLHTELPIAGTMWLRYMLGLQMQGCAAVIQHLCWLLCG